MYSTSTNILIVILVISVFCILRHANVNSDNNSEHFDVTVGKNKNRRTERIKRLNDSRCCNGRFYVNCHACGRRRIIQELYGNRHRRTGCGCNKDGKGFCSDVCKQRGEKTMSFYNDRYVDKDQIFCYNCLRDRYIPSDGVSFTPFAKNYVYWPTLEDPVNGVPSSDGY